MNGEPMVWVTDGMGTRGWWEGGSERLKEWRAPERMARVMRRRKYGAVEGGRGSPRA